MDAPAVEGIAGVFAPLDRELWIVTAAAGPRRGGLAATFVCQASIAAAAPRVVIGLARHHFTWELIETSRTFGLHLVRPDQVEWVWRFCLATGRDVDKLADLPTRPGLAGAPLLTDCVAWLDCRVERAFDTGDRTLYLAAVCGGARMAPGPVLTQSGLLAAATAEQKQALRVQYARDGEIDARAIAAFRR